jgi:hypothetical protein
MYTCLYMTVPETLNRKSEAVLLLVGVLLLTVGTSFLPASWFGIRQQVHTLPPLNLGSLNAIEASSQDTNNDGTISWKEYIAGSLNVPTDALNTVSSSATFSYDTRDMAALNDPNNLTSSFSKNLYIASTALEQNGVTDPQAEQDTVTQLIKTEAAKIKPTTYTASSVKIATSDTVSSLKIYGDAVATIMKGLVTVQSITDDMTSVASFTNSKDEADLVPVVKSTQRVQAALEKLLALPVPQSAVMIHVEILNRVGAYANVLNDLSRAYDDPIRATLAVGKYQDAAVQTLQIFPKLSQFFKEKSVTFSGKDAGYVYIVGYTGK